LLAQLVVRLPAGLPDQMVVSPAAFQPAGRFGFGLRRVVNDSPVAGELFD
jgi:hypothetical protein